MTTWKESGNLAKVPTGRKSSGSQRLDELVRDLAALRAKGLDRSAQVDAPALGACVAALTGHATDEIQAHHYETGFRVGIREMGEGHAAECAAVLFGIAPHVRGLHPIELRKRAAELYYDQTDRHTVDAFRKTREPRILVALAGALLRAGDTRTTSATAAASSRHLRDEPALPETQLVVDHPAWRQRSVPVLLVEPEQPGQLRELTWSEFGQGIDTLRDQIHHYGTNLDIDLAIGINEAGLMMATLLASASFSRCAIGYIRTRSRGTSLRIDDDHSRLGPQLETAAAVLLCDYEVKTAPVISRICDYLREAGLPDNSPCYFAVMGALATESATLDPPVDSIEVSRLACHPVLDKAPLADAFIGCVMASPGIDPPLGLR